MDDLELKTIGTARSLPDGEAILSFLTSGRVRGVLLRAAENGDPPIGAIGPELAMAFPESVANLRTRQLIGMAVRLVLEQAGFVVDQPRKSIPHSPPFRYGTTFRRRESGVAPAPPGLVERFVASLTADEAELAYQLLAKRRRPPNPPGAVGRAGR